MHWLEYFMSVWWAQYQGVYEENLQTVKEGDGSYYDFYNFESAEVWKQVGIQKAIDQWRTLIIDEKGDWKFLLLLVMFEPCLFFLCETFSMKFTTASQGGVIAACFPLCTAVAAWIFLKEKLTGRTIVAIILAVIGVAGSSYFAEGDAKASNPLLGNLLMFGAVLSSSGYAVCVRFISRRYSFLSISAIQAIGGSLAFFPALLSAPMPESVTMPALAGLLYMGVGVGILAYLMLNFSLKYLEAGIVSLFGNLIPVFTLIFAYVLLGERLNVPQVACVGLALFGVAISSTGKKD